MRPLIHSEGIMARNTAPTTLNLNPPPVKCMRNTNTEYHNDIAKADLHGLGPGT